MTQGELFGPAMLGAPRQEPAAGRRGADLKPDPRSGGEALAPGTTRAGEELGARLAARLGLWVDRFTAEYVCRAIERGEETIEFIASDARSGRSAFHVLPAAKLKSM